MCKVHSQSLVEIGWSCATLFADDDWPVVTNIWSNIVLSKCESWSRLWNSRKQRTSQLFISPTSSVPQIHVNGVRTRTYRCVLLILISPSIEWLLNKTLVLLYDSTRTSSLGWTFLWFLHLDSKEIYHFYNKDWRNISPQGPHLATESS